MGLFVVRSCNSRTPADLAVLGKDKKPLLVQIKETSKDKIYVWDDLRELDKIGQKLNTKSYIAVRFKASIIVAMNKSHYDRIFDFSEILGKFSTITIERFRLEDSFELVRKRLDMHRNSREDSLEPFTPDVIKLVHRISQGIPRNILSACDLLFTRAYMEGRRTIDYDFAKPILTGRGFVAETINKFVEDSTVQK